MLPPTRPVNARVLMAVGVVMCTLSVTAIGIAEAFMPDNIHGRNGVLTFYRWFGAGFVCWAVVAMWAFGRRRAIEQPKASMRRTEVSVTNR